MRVDAVGEYQAVALPLRGGGVGAGAGVTALGGGDTAHLQHLQHRLERCAHRPVRDRLDSARRQLRRGGLHRTEGLGAEAIWIRSRERFSFSARNGGQSGFLHC